MLVIDTSVAYKWFVPEPGWREAVAVLAEGGLHAPDLLPLELANIVVRKSRRGEVTGVDGRRIIEAYDRFPVVHHRFQHLILKAHELSVAHQRHPYDCIFVALAIELGCPLITADEKLISGFEKTPFAGIMRSLR